MVQKLSLPSLPKKAVPMPWERKAIYTVETEDGDLMAMGPEELRNYANSQRAGASSDYTKTSEENRARTGGERSKENGALIQARQAAAALEPLVSSAEVGVSLGTDTKMLHILPRNAWDQELLDVEAAAKQAGISEVVMVTGLLQVNGRRLAGQHHRRRGAGNEPDRHARGQPKENRFGAGAA